MNVDELRAASLNRFSDRSKYRPFYDPANTRWLCTTRGGRMVLDNFIDSLIADRDSEHQRVEAWSKTYQNLRADITFPMRTLKMTKREGVTMHMRKSGGVSLVIPLWGTVKGISVWNELPDRRRRREQLATLWEAPKRLWFPLSDFKLVIYLWYDQMGWGVYHASVRHGSRADVSGTIGGFGCFGNFAPPRPLTSPKQVWTTVEHVRQMALHQPWHYIHGPHGAKKGWGWWAMKVAWDQDQRGWKHFKEPVQLMGLKAQEDQEKA